MCRLLAVFIHAAFLCDLDEASAGPKDYLGNLRHAPQEPRPSSNPEWAWLWLDASALFSESNQKPWLCNGMGQYPDTN
jgi:hypothetical protein